MSVQTKPLTIWRITDGRAGHDAQSLGLVAALSDLIPCRCLDISASSWASLWSGLPAPDLIIGAGHRTHLPLLFTKLARGGRTIVLMRPSLPTAWFDLCLIPEHDKPPAQNNILITRGALNMVVPSGTKHPDKGLILVGGPSRHYDWDDEKLLIQIIRILADPVIHWTLTDSPRTPASTRQIFAGLSRDNLIYKPYADTSRDWLADQLSACSRAWVTEDSVSMLYEALTSGAAVGLLKVPAKQAGRIAEAIQKLADDGLITRFDAWTNGRDLKPPVTEFYESARCAKQVLKHFCLAAQPG